MGNANTEAKKRKKRLIQAREFQKTRTWKSFNDLTPLAPEEVMLVRDLAYPNGKGFRFLWEFGHSKGQLPLKRKFG